MTKYRNMHAKSLTKVEGNVFRYTIFFHRTEAAPSVGEYVTIDGYRRKIINLEEKFADFRGDRYIDIYVSQFPSGG